MSHFVTIKTQIKDIEALRSACAEMGFGFEKDAQARGVGTEQRGEYVIRLKGSCDIAVVRQEKGTYGLAADWWDGTVEKEVGKSFGRLLQLYAVHKAAHEARKRGLSVQRRLLSNGTIKLVLTGASL